MQAVDRTVGIGSRAFELMRAYARSASPRSYELWYTYVTGLKPQLNESIKGLIASKEVLADEDIDRLYDTYISDDRLSRQTEKTSGSLLLEMKRVLGLIESAMGTTAEYGNSLDSLNDDLKKSPERDRVREIVETLMDATRSVAESNQELEGRLKASHGEVVGLRRMLEEVRAESLTDLLTGIANRKHFEMALGAGVAMGHGEGTPLILVVIDIDNFKRFNDTYGHLTGDQVIRLVGAAMRENVPPEAVLARFGGEEFAIILPNSTRDDAFACAEKIRKNVMGRELLKRTTGESLGRVTISLGIAELRAEDTATTLLERADSCMYRAKKAGRNNAVADWTVTEESLSSAA